MLAVPATWLARFKTIWVVALCALTAAFALTPIPGHAQAPIRVLFINPAPPEDLYWSLVTDVMRAAARDLGVDLEVQNAFHSREYTLKHASLAAQRSAKPHYIIFRNVEKVAADVFKITQPAGIYTITIDAPLDKSETDAIGGPRQRVSTWLGQFVPNTLAASEQMTDLLVQTTDQFQVTDSRVVVAITGPEDDIGSLMRLRGLQRSLKDITYARLLHAFPANWSERKADRQAYEAFRYGADAPIWWSADDNMALGILNVLRNTHRQVGRDTFVGAFNWTEPMMRAILENKVQYVAGGHFIQGAAALILAHDHHRGRDFVDLGVNQTMTLSFLYRKNVSTIGRVMISGLWDQIDFRRFSRAANPGLAQYDFNVNSYLRAAVGQ
jgi:ABC-type sugar transport system substrate-binding protein